MSGGLRYEWDAAKAVENIRNHGIPFELAIQVFGDPFHVSDQDRIEGGEYRWQTIGVVGSFTMLLVAHGWRDDDGIEVIRIISARRAERNEKVRYERDHRQV